MDNNQIRNVLMKFRDVALDAIGYVGAANYASREHEAISSVISSYAAAVRELCSAPAAVVSTSNGFITDLHRDVMNIPAEDVYRGSLQLVSDMNRAYKAGHRDARHAAAELILAAAASKLPEVKGLSVVQESKYTTDGSSIINRASGEAIPEDEPIVIFRARDKYVRSVLQHYIGLLPSGSPHQWVMQLVLARCEKFAKDFPERMKEPDTAMALPEKPAEYEPIGYQVWAGLIDMQPQWPPYKNREDAEQWAAHLKTNTEIRPIYAEKKL